MSETISPDTTIAQYNVIAKIGEGGMGEVYRARDTKLGRDVAIKVLPAAFSADTERLRRFEQEAQAAGALNHPNILVIFHIGTHDGAPYIVSELLEGETLRERMAGAALPQRKAIDYSLQIAHGLAAAHAKGIVHRDLKPENLFLTKDGRVKILDFGLAKLTGFGDGTQSQTEVPTRRVDTDPGVVMGTIGYMSPEQLRGRAADHRSDIFSFGAILYEMLSGRRAFRGESTADTMSAILREDPPDLSGTNKNIAPALERVVNHCLEKNPEERFHSASDLAFAIGALSGSSSVSTQTITAMTALSARSKIIRHLPWIVAGVLAIALVATLLLTIPNINRAPANVQTLRFVILPPEKTTLASAPFISPDGRRLAFVVTSEGKTLLWVRSLDSPTAQPLAGTDGAFSPFWSPDSRYLGFFASGKLKKTEAGGGPPQTLCDAADGRGGTWSRDGTIIFTPTSTGNMFRVPASGGVPAPLTTLDQSRQENSHRWPDFLPDGRRFIYFARSTQTEKSGIYAGSLDSKDRKLILGTDRAAKYADPGHLLFVREKTLMAQQFDAKSLQLSGEPFPVAEDVDSSRANQSVAVSLSQTGVLAYGGVGVVSSNRHFVWFDHNGKSLSVVEPPGEYRDMALSPDEKRVAMQRYDVGGGPSDIWLLDLVRSTPSRFTFDPTADDTPFWSPDGAQIVFSSDRAGHSDIYRKVASGAGNDELLLQSDVAKYPTDWSHDGQSILFENLDPKTKSDIWILPLFGDGKPFPFLQTGFNEWGARFSPDGHWIAYVSDESGKTEVYVQSFPSSGGKWLISNGGGGQPRWSYDGKQLFYIAPDRKLMAVEVKTGTTLEASVPVPLFDSHVDSYTASNRYAVSRDGRFLINQAVEETVSAPMTIVVNWLVKK